MLVILKLTVILLLDKCIGLMFIACSRSHGNYFVRQNILYKSKDYNNIKRYPHPGFFIPGKPRYLLKRCCKRGLSSGPEFFPRKR